MGTQEARETTDQSPSQGLRAAYRAVMCSFDRKIKRSGEGNTWKSVISHLHFMGPKTSHMAKPDVNGAAVSSFVRGPTS